MIFRLSQLDMNNLPIALRGAVAETDQELRRRGNVYLKWPFLKKYRKLAARNGTAIKRRIVYGNMLIKAWNL